MVEMGNGKVRLGIIGLGPRGQYMTHLYAGHPNCSIVALCDNVLATAETIAGQLGNPDIHCYSDYEVMLAKEALDAVYIAIPPDVQVQLACYAMDKGIHVTTDVPAAYTIDQCWELVNKVEQTGVKYQLSEQTRYWGFIQEWRDMAHRGEFGHILFAEGEYLHYAEWDYFIDPKSGERFYGSATAPEGRAVEKTWRNKRFYNPIYYLPHTLSPLLSIIGGRVTRVSCMGTRPQSYYVPNYEGRDMEIALMHTDNDTVLRVAAGFTSPHGPRGGTGAHWYHLKGSHRTVEWSRSLQDKPKMWSVNENDGDWQDMDWSLTAKGATDFTRQSEHGGADGWPVDNFISAILTDAKLEMDVYKAVETAAPAILAAESSNEGGTLKIVPDFREKR
ncbi:Gfo/Idh/MocA family protein [Paenibacillus mendelii]|uniref:Gfo/Idh/MocA family protein n=1 Tax=Paenibacillus mendelii TaxID=206163 RepID=A0ABV6JFA5_9BACL|nr:Gfo/Idh/MocA family oxidoreductase [Paenibacillus mendelii]MCQ6557479.1 Gfo/Idh/MocA family oxidoreductase [Paenibacillus mendelii]